MELPSGYSNMKIIDESQVSLVCAATREADQQPVVIKALRGSNPTPNDISFLYHEFEITKHLTLAGVIKTYDLIHDKGQYALVLESMQGMRLSRFIADRHTDQMQDFYQIASKMIEIVGELQKNHIIHKNIQPDNFIIDPHTLTLKLTDFHFATKLSHEVQAVVPPDKLEGTLAYLAPEQTGRVNMNIDYRTDFYALGVTFYQMLTGELPFRFFDPLEMIHAHIATPPPDASASNPSVPKSLAQLIQKLMAKDPADRYQSVVGIQVDLEKIAQNETAVFELGQGEVRDHLNLSEKLYGREAEINTLMSVYHHVSHGESEVLMVSGYSGIGKTVLIHEVHKPMVQDKGYFIAGMFDQLQRNTPFTAITQALNELAKTMMLESAHRFEQIKDTLLQALGDNGQIIIDLAPELEKVIGVQPSLQPLPPNESENRMKVVFARFIQAMSTSDHPLVIFIDDLQWVDSGSLRLLEYILTEKNIQYLLLIGAYRDSEVGENHPLNMMLRQMANVNVLQIKPLSVDHCCEFLCDSLNVEKQAVLPLAQIIHAKTEGNPLFFKQLLMLLYQDELLYFDYQARSWQWHLEGIEAKSITDNVVALMINRLSQLPTETLSLLHYAACVGNRFTLETLQVISNQPTAILAKSLWPAMEQELIVSLNAGYKQIEVISQGVVDESLSSSVFFQFLHDRIQQAVYQSVSESKRQLIHLDIAQHLLRKDPQGCKNEKLFEVTDHLNTAGNLIDESMKMLVVELNAQSGERALAANAYKPMMNYYQFALNWVDDDWWQTHYELCMKLHFGYATSQYLLRNLDEALLKTKELLAKVKSGLDKANIYKLQMAIFQSRREFLENIRAGFSALRALGVKLKSKPSTFDLFYYRCKVKWMMRRYHIDKIEKELPEIKDEAVLKIIEIMKELTVNSYWQDQKLSAYLSMISMVLMLQHGKSIYVANFGIYYGIYLLNYFKDLESCYAYFQMSERLAIEYDDKRSLAIYTIVGVVIMTHRGHIRECMQYFARSLRTAHETGNIWSEIAARGNFGFNELAQAKSLRQCIDEFHSVPEHYMYKLISLFEYLATPQHNEPEIAIKIDAFLSEQSSNYLRLQYELTASFYFFFKESYQRTLELLLQWYPYEILKRFEANTNQVKTICALTILRQWHALHGMNKWRYKKILNDVVSHLKWCAQVCPVNFLHHYLFLQGAKAKSRGAFFRAAKLFNEAIKNAKQGDFYLWVALGNELAGEMFMEQNQDKLAYAYLLEAHYYYDLYGMAIKVQSLEKRYPECFIDMRSVLSSPHEATVTSLEGTTSTTVEMDFLSIIKASQALSGVFVVKQLFEKMLDIVIENAGADRVIFLEKIKNIWMVNAKLEYVQSKTQFQLIGESLEQCQGLPKTMIQYVARSQQTVVLTNAMDDILYQQDPYILDVQPKSVMCLPIIHQEALVGIIYLENNLTVGAFTQERVTVLTTLASQIAISLVNIRYIEEMSRIHQRTQRFVPKRFLELILKENIEDIELGDCKEYEITVLFNDIRDFTTHLEMRSPTDAFGFVNRYWDFMAPIIRKHGGYIDQFQGDAALAIFPTCPDDALQAGKGMLTALSALNDKQRELGERLIDIGIGLNTGRAMLGIVGEKERLESAVISDVTNTAARVESLNKAYHTHLLLSDTSVHALQNPDQYQLRRIDKVILKGRSQATYLYEVIDWADHLQGISLDEYVKQFDLAFDEYEQGDFVQSEALLKVCQSHYPQDPISEILMARCAQFIAEGPPAQWDGTYKLSHK